MARTFHAACQSQDSLRFVYLFTIAFVQYCLLSGEMFSKCIRDENSFLSSFLFFFVLFNIFLSFSLFLSSTTLFSLDYYFSSVLLCICVLLSLLPKLFRRRETNASYSDMSFVQFKINFAKHITFICYIHYTLQTHTSTPTPILHSILYFAQSNFMFCETFCYATLRNQHEKMCCYWKCDTKLHRSVLYEMYLLRFFRSVINLRTARLLWPNAKGRIV